MEKNKGFKRIVLAGGYSLQGLKAAFKHEAAFRQEVLLALIFIPLAFFVSDTAIERVMLVMVTVLVMVAELLNSAIEAVVDRIGDEWHELAGRAKDIGSAAVLVCLLLWAYVWLELVVFNG